MQMLLAVFGTLSESGRLALLGSTLIGVALVLRKILQRNHVPLTSPAKAELPAK